MTAPRTDLRDARLHKALANAPDGDALPHQRTRENIKSIANYSIRTWEKVNIDPPKPWWNALGQRLWQRSGRTSGPWNAAFATLLLGGIITLIWQGQEVPDAALDERPAAQTVPGAELPAPAVKPSVNSPVKPPVKPPVPAAAPAPALNDAPLATVPKPKPKPEPVPIPVPKPAPEPEPALATAPEQRLSPSASDQAAAAASRAEVSQAPLAPSPAPAPAPPPAPSETVTGSVAERITRNDANNRSRAAMVAPAAVQPGGWTVADMLYRGRTTRLARNDAQTLLNRALAQVNAAAASPSAGAGAGGGTPLLRLQLRDQDNPDVVAQLDLWENAVRWQRAGQADVLRALTPEAVAGVLAEAARALPP